MPIFLLIILIFTIWLTYELKKSTKNNTSSSADFWKRESEAAYVPAKSTEDVNFVTLDESLLPVIGYDDDPDIKEYTAELKSLCNRQLADLSSYTNTDLKLKYGTRNFQPLCDADADYTKVVTLISKLLPLLIDNNRLDDAGKLLEYTEQSGMSGRSITVSRGRYYAAIDDTDSLNKLINSVRLNSPSSDKLIVELTQLLEKTACSDDSLSEEDSRIDEICDITGL